MKNRYSIRAVVATGVVAIALGSASVVWADGKNEQSATHTHHVEIRGFEFKPKTLSVSPGDTIIFTNHDIVPHTATAIDDSWNTGELGTGESGRVTISSDATVDYYCIFHPSMKASLILR